MPIRWFTCPSGERVEITDCLSEGGCRMSSRCATPAYLRMAASDRPWTGKPSTTQLISGTNSAFLKLTEDYSVCPYDRAFMIHGTNAHSKLESYSTESMVEVKLDGPDTPVTGIFDVLIQEGGKNILVDYKTSGSYKVMIALGWKVIAVPTEGVYKSGPRKGQQRTVKMLKRDDEWIDRDEWDLQLNMYRIMLEKQGHPVDEMRIQCIVRDGNTWMARSRGVLRNVYYFKIRRLADAVVLDYFNKKREALFAALEAGECDSLCNAKENWGGIKCEKYCEVAEFCALGKYLKKEKEKEAIYMNTQIKGFSDVRHLPRLGKIALGNKVATSGGKERPNEIDYFRMRPDTPSEEMAQSIIAEFHGLFGENPKAIEIMLPLSDRGKIFPQNLRRYTGGGLQCKGDGEVAVCMSQDAAEGLEITGDDDGMIEVKCLYKECPNFGPKGCKEVGTLNIAIPKMRGAGIWQITTSSFYSTANINSCLDYIEAMAGRFGMIPLILERRPQEIQHKDKNGKRSKRTHWILHIRSEMKLADIQRAGQIDETKALLALPEADDAIEEAEFEPIVDDDAKPEPEEEPETDEPEKPEEEDDTIPFPTKEETEAERAKMQAELGKNDAESRGGKRQAVMDLLKDTHMKNVGTPGYKTFAKNELGKAGFPLSELLDGDLDALITALNMQINANGDKNAKEQGDLGI